MSRLCTCYFEYKLYQCGQPDHDTSNRTGSLTIGLLTLYCSHPSCQTVLLLPRSLPRAPRGAGEQLAALLPERRLHQRQQPRQMNNIWGGRKLTTTLVLTTTLDVDDTCFRALLPCLTPALCSRRLLPTLPPSIAVDDVLVADGLLIVDGCRRRLDVDDLLQCLLQTTMATTMATTTLMTRHRRGVRSLTQTPR